jgi:hypothetical protein
MANLTGASQLDSGGIPTGSVKVPGVTALKAIQGGAVYTDTLGDDSAPIRSEAASSSKATYTYTISATAPYATPTDWVVLRGSATKTVKVVRIEYSGVATAATAGNVVFIKKHTVANTAGTSTTPAFIKHDSSDGAGTAVILLYSAAPTIDATATTWKTVRITYGLVAAAAGTWAQDRYVWEYGQEPYEPMVLRGVAQELAFNYNSVAIPSGGVFDLSVTWVEE